MAVSKTNRTGRESKSQRTHFCPDCGEASKMHKHMPGGAMWGHCKNGHAFRKKDLSLR